MVVMIGGCGGVSGGVIDRCGDGGSGSFVGGGLQ